MSPASVRCLASRSGCPLDGFRKLRFEHLCDPLVESLALGLQQRVVRRVFEQGVLEDVAARSWRPFVYMDLGLHQLAELGAECSVVQRRDGSNELIG